MGRFKVRPPALGSLEQTTAAVASWQCFDNRYTGNRQHSLCELMHLKRNSGENRSSSLADLQHRSAVFDSESMTDTGAGACQLEAACINLAHSRGLKARRSGSKTPTLTPTASLIANTEPNNPRLWCIVVLV
ncbi:hypothetical protein P4O66_012290 [Electrophorus voltai]|uniref:Uncharacterized protein n=1 Tax=Electrophorus voltai TaxID=2609070 RepID=A0AAD8Z4F9_9TELE|nr:hypothetical protein P4O66_012290 [Electrophorus voltai]